MRTKLKMLYELERDLQLIIDAEIKDIISKFSHHTDIIINNEYATISATIHHNNNDFINELLDGAKYIADISKTNLYKLNNLNYENIIYIETHHN